MVHCPWLIVETGITDGECLALSRGVWARGRGRRFAITCALAYAGAPLESSLDTNTSSKPLLVRLRGEPLVAKLPAPLKAPVRMRLAELSSRSLSAKSSEAPPSDL